MYRPSADDFDDIHVTECSAEPMARADHKAKRHSRPRHNEKIGGGHFVFGRGRTTGRIKAGGRKMPFEHPDFDSAFAEAGRLHSLTGRTFDVFSRTGSVGPIDEGEFVAVLGMGAVE